MTEWVAKAVEGQAELGGAIIDLRYCMYNVHCRSTGIYFCNYVTLGLRSLLCAAGEMILLYLPRRCGTVLLTLDDHDSHIYVPVTKSETYCRTPESAFAVTDRKCAPLT